MAELILRDYQAKLVEDIRQAWRRNRSVIAWLPTGGGKTEVSVHFAKAEAAQGGCTLFVVDRKTLAKQTRERFGLKYGMLTGVVRGEDTFLRGYEPAIVASVQSLQSRWESLEIKAALSRVTLVVIDECHIKFAHHQAIIEHLPNARILGLSATPLRDGLAQIFGALVKGPSYANLIESGHLVPCRYFLPHIEDVQRGLRGVDIASTGDYVQNQLSALMRQRTIIGDVVETWKEKSENRPTIAFCVNIPHSKELCDGFQAAGVTAEHIDLHTSEEDRTAIFKRFREGTTRVLCSINVLAVGFDAPEASCVILARPTRSLIIHIQQIGRGMRPADGKVDALVLDHSANVLRFGKVEDFDPPELSEIDKRTDTKPQEHAQDYFPCPECRAIMSPGQRVCHECGHEIARRNTVDFAPGQLVEEDGKRETPSLEAMRDLYLELKFIGEHSRKRDGSPYAEGWPYYQLRDHFRGFEAPWAWKSLPPKVPTQRTLNLVRSWRIAYSKAAKKGTKPRVSTCRCGSRQGVVRPGTGPHGARLDCADCGRFLRWLPKVSATG